MSATDTRSRLESLLATSKFDSVEEAVRSTCEAVEVFEQGTPQADDVTVLALRLNRIRGG